MHACRRASSLARPPCTGPRTHMAQQPGCHKCRGLPLAAGPRLRRRYGYSKLLASSVFCFALMGDGWASRFDDAIVHGCVPCILWRRPLPWLLLLLRLGSGDAGGGSCSSSRGPQEQTLGRSCSSRQRWRRPVASPKRPASFCPPPRPPPPPPPPPPCSCIPVVIQDEIEQAWHGVLDLDSYTGRGRDRRPCEARHRCNVAGPLGEATPLGSPLWCSAHRGERHGACAGNSGGN